MDVEVTVSGDTRELASSDQEEPNFEDSDLEDDTKEESGAGDEVKDEEESDSQDDEKGKGEDVGGILVGGG